jgi:hypothetical protein
MADNLSGLLPPLRWGVSKVGRPDLLRIAMKTNRSPTKVRVKKPSFIYVAPAGF